MTRKELSKQSVRLKLLKLKERTHTVRAHETITALNEIARNKANKKKQNYKGEKESNRLASGGTAEDSTRQS